MWLIVSNQRYLVLFKLILYADKTSFNVESIIELFFQRLVSIIKWSRLPRLSVPTASFLKTTYRGAISSWRTRRTWRRKKNTSYNTLKNFLNMWVSIVNLLLRAFDFWVVWNHCVILHHCEVNPCELSLFSLLRVFL